MSDVSKPYVIRFLVDAFSGGRSVDRADLGHRALVILLDALVAINCNFFRKYPTTPRLYKSGIRYEYEQPGIEEWQDVPTTVARGYGDCEDLACYRAAELQILDGVPAWPLITWKRMKNGAWLYHIRVGIDAGKEGHVIEDPSVLLGMRTGR